MTPIPIIPFSKPTLGQEEEEAVLRVLRSGWLAAGPETEAFEQEFSNYISPPGEHYYCIFTNSCTSALKMAYKYTRESVQPGLSKLVHYPVNTYCATYSAAREMGLVAYSRETDDHSSENDRLKFGESNHPQLMRVNVHYGGVKDETPCLIEDSAHRIEPSDPLVGKMRCYSFYATKNMTTGSGGMFVTNDKEIYDRARLYWRDGLSTSTRDRADGNVFYTVSAMAGGYDGNDLAAALGRVQLEKLPRFTARRNEIVQRYNAAFGNDWRGNHLYPVFVEKSADVAELIGYLRQRDISASYHYPGTGWLGVSLPLYPLLTDAEVDTIIAAVKAWQHGT